jgi:acetylornithine/N-succinyldiaminopimelate aminotransferase
VIRPRHGILAARFVPDKEGAMTAQPTTLANPFAALIEITSRPPIVFTEGQGSWLADAAGKRYLDFIQGWAVNCLGHSPPALVEALTAQARTLMNCSPAYYNARAIELANLIAGESGLHQSFFANSGAEANEGAIKLARKWGQKHRDGAFEIVTMDHGFHGRTLATMSASGKPQWDALYEPKVPGFTKVPLGDLAAIEAVIGPKTVAVMLEPIQGEAGVYGVSDAHLRELRALTKARGILLILDEIQTGMGRTGTMFAYQHAGILPDIMTLGKGLGGGVPLAALVAHKDVVCFEHGDQGGTFNGNPLMCAVGVAVVEALIAPGVLAQVTENGNYLAGRLAALSQRYGFGEVRGRGLLLALNLKRPIGPKIVEQALDRGLLLNAPRPDCLRFMPSLVVSRGEIDQMMETLGTICGEGA